MVEVNTGAIQWWLGDLADKFEENKHVLEDLDLEAESRLDNEIKDYLSKIPSVLGGHGFPHHQRVRTFTAIIGVVNDHDIESIKTCRYAASIHDISKELGKGGKGPHNWPKLRKLTRDLMRTAKIEESYIPKVIGVIEEHHEDDSSKRSKDGNVLYEGDTADLTYLPRCFDFAASLSGLYPNMDRVIEDYTGYQIGPSTPITPAGKRMFETGKNWALPTLEKLRGKLGDENLEPYFPFLDIEWRKNMNNAPPILNETLNAYKKFIPNYEISLF